MNKDRILPYSSVSMGRSHVATTTGSVDGPSHYTFRNSDAEGSQQLHLLAHILDEHTTDVLARIAGIAGGWRCLDVGYPHWPG
jgi:hypothetical protein